MATRNDMGCITVGAFLLISGTIVSIVLGGLILPIFIQPRSVALESAKRYSQSLAEAGQFFTVASCLSADNDNDGKITCTAVANDTGATRQWHCESTLWAKFFQGSCSDARPITINGGN